MVCQDKGRKGGREEGGEGEERERGDENVNRSLQKGKEGGREGGREDVPMFLSRRARRWRDSVSSAWRRLSKTWKRRCRYSPS